MPKLGGRHLWMAPLSNADNTSLFQSDTEDFGLLNAFSLVTMIFLQRDYPVTVRTTPSRILYFVTCVAAFMVFAFYTAVLTSYMTAQDAPPTIKVRMGYLYRMTHLVGNNLPLT